MKLSVIVITKNGEATIGRCLESVAWAQELIVLDSGSTDSTRAIARERGAAVHESPEWPGFGAQKNRALEFAGGEWVFSLDADEWVTPDLRAEIGRALEAPGGKVAFAMPRRSSFCGRVMRHSGWWPDHITRVFRRGSARFSDDLVHERLIVEGATGKLRAPLLHEAITSLDQVIAKNNAYSSAGAESLHRRGRRASFSGALAHGWWAFVRTYFLRLGFLDGREGFMLAVANAEVTYYKYMKLMLLCARRPQQGDRQ